MMTNDFINTMINGNHDSINTRMNDEYIKSFIIHILVIFSNQFFPKRLK